MSANLDLVRSIYADWERGDFSQVDWARHDIEYADVDGLAPGRVTGLKAMAARWRDFMSDWGDFRAEAEGYRELEDERVLVWHRFSGRGKTSGLELDALSTRGADLIEIHEGKVTKIVKYYVLDRALADLGLEE